MLGIASSLRSGSYNRMLLRASQEHAPDDIHLSVFELKGVPFFDDAVEQHGDPPTVAALKRAIHEADAVLIATPE